MPQSLRAVQPNIQHPISPKVQLEREIRASVLRVSSKDKKVQQLRKHVQSGINRAPETLATLLTECSPVEGIAFGDRISAIYRHHIPKNRRTFKELSLLETREEGDVNPIQEMIVGGDTSTPTLTRFKKELVEYIIVLKEIEEVVDNELAARV